MNAPEQKKLKVSELPAYRQRLFVEQGGIDPILNRPITVPVLDHRHSDGVCRMVLQRESNSAEGKVFNTWRRYIRHLGVPIDEWLRGLTDYYARDFSCGLIHPTHKDADEKRELRNKRARRKRNQKKAKQ